MWTSTHEGRTTATPAQVYALLADVSSWPSWNAGVAGVDIDGPFRAGTTARMTLPDGTQLPFTISWAEPGVGFEDVTDLPEVGVLVRVRHTVGEVSGGASIGYHCLVEGAPDDVCARVGEQVCEDFDDVIAALAAAAAR